MQDYPAAHSMDTTWFAVDAEGNLGIFDSGEGGAVPESNGILRRQELSKPEGGIWFDYLHELFAEWAKDNETRVISLNIPAQIILERLSIDMAQFTGENLELITDETIKPKKRKKIARKILPSSGSTPWVDEAEISDRSSDLSWGVARRHWLLVISGNEEITLNILKQRELKFTFAGDYQYLVKFLGEPNLIFIGNCSLETLEILFKEGLISHAIPLDTYRNGAATLLGLYSYRQDYSDPLPYECDGQPLFPLNLDDLPERLQDWVSWNWFDRIQFSENLKIQPIEHMRCDTWSISHQWWMDCEGNEREGHPYG